MGDTGGGHGVGGVFAPWKRGEVRGEAFDWEGYMSFLEENIDLSFSLPLSSGLAVVGVTRALWWQPRRLRPRRFCSRHGYVRLEGMLVKGWVWRASGL